jgi:hypothetical protein
VYRVVVDRAAVEQIAALPTEALPFYAEVLDVLELAPSGGRPYNDDLPEGPMWELVFGATDEGTVTYLLLEQQREVHVLLVQWIG